MVSNRVYTILNVALVLIAIVLTLHFFRVEIPSLGEAQYALDNSERLCVVNWKDNYNELTDYNRCCLDAAKVGCVPETQRTPLGITHWKCGTDNAAKYLLNNKVRSYCRLQPFG